MTDRPDDSTAIGRGIRQVFGVRKRSLSNAPHAVASHGVDVEPAIPEEVAEKSSREPEDASETLQPVIAYPAEVQKRRVIFTQGGEPDDVRQRIAAAPVEALPVAVAMAESVMSAQVVEDARLIEDRVPAPEPGLSLDPEPVLAPKGAAAIPVPKPEPKPEPEPEEPPLPNPMEFEPTEEIWQLLYDKVDEFRLLGYGSVTADDLWAYLRARKKRRPRNLHELVNAVLCLMPQEFMNYAMQQVYREIGQPL